MALIQCDECKKEVSDKASVCPNCGNPISAPEPQAAPIFVQAPAREKRVPGGAKFVAWVLIIIGVFSIFSVGLIFILIGILILTLGKTEVKE